MTRFVFILSFLAIAFSGCTVLYSTASTWINPDNSNIYQFNAEYATGSTGRKIVIFCNGKKLMVGKAHYWSKRITMTSELDGKPIAAECGGEDGARICVISVSGEKIAQLKF
jgi:hypothetical protein